jgi:hypothetical protein
VPDRLLIPEKLYGREREIDALLAAYDRVVAQGTPELVLVSGYSGIGKSSVVNELHKVLVPPRGLFASGKFDQYKRNIPYATLAQAFQGLVRPLLGQSEAELGRWRDALSEALGPNGQLIVDLVPELEMVIGTQPPVADLSPQDAKNRFRMVFRRFLGVFARKEHPLALFLDDLQWLDTATLDLLEHLVTHWEVRNLLLVGAFPGQQAGVQRCHYHLFINSLLLRGGNQLTVGAPDQCGAGVVWLVLGVLWPAIDVARPAHLICQNGETCVLTGAQGIFLQKCVRIAASDSCARRGIVPELETAGMRHANHVGTAQCQHARNLGELVVVADYDANLART